MLRPAQRWVLVSAASVAGTRVSFIETPFQNVLRCAVIETQKPVTEWGCLAPNTGVGKLYCTFLIRNPLPSHTVPKHPHPSTQGCAA